MNGGYTLHDLDLFAPGAETVRLRPAPGAAGMGCILRDGCQVIGFRLLRAAEVPAGGLTREDLLSDEARAASAYVRLRRDLVQHPAPAAPGISVAICTKDRPDWLRRLLRSLAQQRTERTFEVVVVDNNSESPEVRTIAEEAGAIYVRETRTGLDFARNRAVQTAKGDVIAFLDDDTRAEPEWFEALSQVWAENPDAGCVTGQILPMSLDSAAHVAFERDGGFRHAFLPERYGPVRWKNTLHPCGPGELGVGANMSFSRDLLRDLGGFDEALDTGRPLPGGGDLDIFYRVLRAGRILVYDPRIVVRHDHRSDMKVLRHQYYTWGLGYFAFLQKTRKSDPENATALAHMELWVWLYMARRFLRSLIGRDSRSFRMIAAEIQGAIKGRFGEYERSQHRSAAIRRAAE